MIVTAVPNDVEKEIHPWHYYIPEGATTLYIGTFPTYKDNRKHLDFFYASNRNRFWRLTAEMASIRLIKTAGEAGVHNRKEILEKLKLGLTDMGYEVLRQKKNSSDNSLFPLSFVDVFDLLKKNPTIKNILVSGNEKKNSSLGWFSIYSAIKGVSINIKELNDKSKNNTIIYPDGKRIQVFKVISTSGTANRIPDEEVIAGIAAGLDLPQAFK